MSYMKWLKFEIIERFQNNPELYNKVMEDCNRWLKDEYSMPVTKELRQIIDDLQEGRI